MKPRRPLFKHGMLLTTEEDAGQANPLGLFLPLSQRCQGFLGIVAHPMWAQLNAIFTCNRIMQGEIEQRIPGPTSRP